MRAALFHARHDIRIEDVPEPEAPGPHEVLLRPALCGICGTDLHEFTHGPIVVPSATPHPLTGAVAPQILGHEFSARVLAVGAEVTKVAEGDRVSVMPLIYCGACYYCRRGLNHLCVQMACTGLSWHGGGIAEQVVVPDYQVEKLPDQVGDVQGALVEPTAVAAYGIDRTGFVPGDTVLITGAGPIGALSALYAHAGGAAQVIVSEPDAGRRKLVDELGVALTLDPTTTDVPEAVRELTQGVGADVAAECSGSEAGLAATLAAVRSRGTVAQVGLHVRPAAIDPMDLSNRDITLTGTWCYPVQDWPRIIALLASGRLPIEKVVSDVIDAADVVSLGFERLVRPGTDVQKILVRT
jgi:(R,R)-butanediol dehydrogenase/meso-butanediol dehydrogenase/diacetyl reductase